MWESTESDSERACDGRLFILVLLLSVLPLPVSSPACLLALLSICLLALFCLPVNDFLISRSRAFRVHLRSASIVFMLSRAFNESASIDASIDTLFQVWLWLAAAFVSFRQKPGLRPRLPVSFSPPSFSPAPRVLFLLVLTLVAARAVAIDLFIALILSASVHSCI